VRLGLLVNPFELVVLRLMRLSRRLHLSRLVWMATKTGSFMDYFKGFEKAAAIKAIFGEKTEQVLRNLKVEFIPFGYMGVDNTDGHLLVNAKYLNSGDKTDLYLDVVHELCHVKQWREGKELFDYNYDYVDRPTEVEAYRYTVLEAKRIGLGKERILDYLKTEWLSQGDLDKLIKNMQVNLEPT
jgi:hypothetical protein